MKKRPLVEYFISRIRPKLSVMIELTDGCNLRCPFCYVDRKGRLKTRYIKESTFSDIIRRYKPLYIQIGGGEPTMHPKFLNLLKFALDNALGVRVYTNGTLIGKHLQDLIELKKKPTITFSLDAPDKNHDTIRNCNGLFKNVIHSMRVLREHSFPIACNMTVFNEGVFPRYPSGNLKHVKETLAFSERWGIPWSIQPYMPSDKETREQLGKIFIQSRNPYLANSMPFRKLLLQGNTGPCRINWTHISFSSSGRRLPTFEGNCFFTGRCDDCYYSCVWEPSFLTSKHVITTLLSILKRHYPRH